METNVVPPADSSEGDGGPALDLVYRDHEPLLRSIAVQKFRVPAEDVPVLVQDVFVSYLQHYERVENTRAWLVGAMCNRSRNYWRQRERDGVTPADFESCDVEAADDGDGANLRLDLASMLMTLPERCRRLLRLRFAEGATPGEIAAELDTTVGYAKKLVHGCIAAARRYFRDSKGKE